ncbi:outer membrane protein assembly factor BamE [Chthonobacter rhizosphaerae]|uniref:outer membrane protein assembly factor BamE n=1 Tax=Chthonobacter rhizosphaerae TaxID=2735553 RepID=UPI0015EFB524|nr:outer membrane protein assembly factor BamE [Chthonobacter rhizosphaerae]
MMTIKLCARVVVLTAVTALTLTACGTPPRQHGYVLSESALEQVPVGSSREQVLLVLGTPSTTSTLAGDTFYYISQTTQDSPWTGRSVTDQRVLAVYFTEEGTVREIANYGLKDGRVFDFIERRTRAGGADLNLISQILGSVGRTNPFGNSQARP